MSFPPTDKTFEGLLRDQQQRIQLLERRQKMTLPARLGGADGVAEQVIDWNAATDSGFYQSDSSAWNAPFQFWWNGHVVNRWGEVVQRLSRVDASVEWVRSKSGAGANLAYNSNPVSTGLNWEWWARWGWTVSYPSSGGQDGGPFIRFTCPATQDSGGRGWDIYGNGQYGSPEVGPGAWTARWVTRGDWIRVRAWVRSWNAASFYVVQRVHNGVAWKTGQYAHGPSVPNVPGQWTRMEWQFQAAETGWISSGVYADPGTTFNQADVIDVQWLEWVHVNGVWTRWRRSDRVVHPKSIQGAAIEESTGRIVFNDSTSDVILNGCFTGDYKAYRILFQYGSNGSNGGWIRLRTNGNDQSGGSAEYQGFYTAGTTNTVIRGTGDTISWPAVAGFGFQGELIVMNPLGTNGLRKRVQSRWGGQGPPTETFMDLNMDDGNSYDGLHLQLQSNFAPGGGWMTVEGIA